MDVKTASSRRTSALADDPLSGEQLLLDSLFGNSTRAPRPAPSIAKPQHYKIVSISLYNEDIERLEGLVRELRRRGHYKANKSQVIRQALAQLDVDRVPKI